MRERFAKTKRSPMWRRGASLLLTCAMALSTAAAVTAPLINTPQAAGEVPGTTQYYEARWEESKTRFGKVEANTAYTDYQGNSASVAIEGPWMLENLKEKVDSGELSAPWNGAADAPTETAEGGAYNVSSNPYLVYTAEQLRYCMANHLSFRLMKDIDLGGYMNQNWTRIAGVSTAWIADGNGHTIYNLYMNGTTVGTSFFSNNLNMKVTHLRFANSYVRSTADYTSLFFCNTVAYTKYAGTIQNCSIEKCWVRGQSATAGFSTGSRIQGVYTSYVKDSAVFGEDHIAATLSYIGGLEIQNSFSENCVVISTGGHSGGFLSCSPEVSCTNCFSSNVDMYSGSDAGGFFSIDGGSFTNCFSSGKMEGVSNLGGFLAANSNNACTVENCYTTNMVGMISGSNVMGGFIGSASLPGSITISNSYAAGEVGSIDTMVTPDRTTHTTVGGFTGTNNNRFTYQNCYYDKQTTAMREWETGTTQDGGAGDISGITGMLTTTTNKASIGMTDADWDGLGDAFNTDLGDGYYPQLDVFSNPVTFTGFKGWITDEEVQELVKACSLASVSTVQMETWEKDYAGNALPPTTYDTVRDVVADFSLTSGSGTVSGASYAIDKWERCGVTGQSTLSNGTGAQSGVDFGQGTHPEVIELTQQGGEWIGTQPMPGIDWVRVTASVNGTQATRSLRICPTVGMDAGLSQYLGESVFYDHADDMRMAYSTGGRMDQDAGKITYGVFPDSPLAAGQNNFLNTSDLANVANLTALFGQTGQNNAFSNINVAHMERTSTDLNSAPRPINSTSGVINEVIIRPVLSENADGSITLGDPVDLTDPTQAAIWNGEQEFPTDQRGKVYNIEYVWSLTDGRFLKDSKRVEVSEDDYNVTIRAENLKAEPVSYEVFMDAYDISDGNGSLDPNKTYAFGNSTKAQDALTGQIHSNPAATSWKLRDDSPYDIKELKIKMTSLEGDLSREVIIPASELPTASETSKTIQTLAPYRAHIRDLNGNLVWQTLELEKQYTIALSADGVYTIQFDKEYEDYNSGIFVDDLDMNIDVVVVLNTEDTEKPRNLTISKEVIGQNADLNKEFTSTAVINGQETTFTLKHGESYSFTDLPVGTQYTVTETDYTAEGYIAQVKTYTGTITGTEELLLPFVNVYDDGQTQPGDSQGNLALKKEVIGANPDPNKEFTFQVTFSDGGTYTYQIDGGQAQSIASGGTIILKANQTAVIHNLPENVTYTVEEIDAAGYLPSIDTADGMIAGGQTANVTFLNRVADTGTNVTPVVIDLPIIQKVIEGNYGTAEAKFEFLLQGQNGAPMPQGSDGNTKILTLNGSGELEIGQITFEQAGTFTYTITEINGNLPGWTYDNAAYTLTVTVTDNNGTLTASHVLTKDGAAASELIFTNVYGASDSSNIVALSGTKTWNHGTNPEENRPTSITVYVYADGELCAEKQVTAQDNWSYVFEGLSKYAQDGHEIQYTVGEAAVADYQTEVKGYHLVNTHVSALNSGNTGNTGNNSNASGDSNASAGAAVLPQTGDNSALSLWFILLVMSLAGVIGVSMLNKTHSRRNNR